MRIKELRESRNLTQEELARMMHLKRSSVAMWETGASFPGADKLPELAKILNCEVSELFGNEQ